MSKKHRNILEIINLYGSAANFIGGQFTYLREKGYNMHLICGDDPELPRFAEKHAINYKSLYLKREGLSLIWDFKALVEVCKYIKTNDIDTVIAHQAKARLIGTTAAFLMRVPNRIIFAHGVLYETMHGVKRWGIKMMDKVVAAMVHKVVCVSPSVANVRVRDGINKPSKNYILNHGTCGGIDTEHQFNPALYNAENISTLKTNMGLQGCNLVVGFCGRMVRDKGIIELIDAFKLLKESYSNKVIKLLIIGPNEVRDSVSEYTKEIIKYDKDIIFTGRIRYEKMAEYYMLMDVFVLPSYREGFGMVTIEAGAMGVPSIVSRSTGCIDSIEEYKTGIYSDINPYALKHAMELFLDSSYKNELARNCRKYVVENYDQKVVWPHIINVIEA